MNDGYFDDVPFVRTTAGTYPDPAPRQPGTVAEGGFWSVVRRGEAYVLDYVSGELAGRARQVVISEEEAHRLESGDDEAAMAVINAHGGG